VHSHLILLLTAFVQLYYISADQSTVGLVAQTSPKNLWESLVSDWCLMAFSAETGHIEPQSMKCIT